MKTAWDPLVAWMACASAPLTNHPTPPTFFPFLFKSPMLSVMLFPTHNFKILYLIVCSNIIFVVNDFSKKEFSSEIFFHYVAMLKNMGIVYSYSKIKFPRTMWVFCQNFFMKIFYTSPVRKITTFQRTIFNTSSNSIRPSFKFLATCATNGRYGPSLTKFVWI